MTTAERKLSLAAILSSAFGIGIAIGFSIPLISLFMERLGYGNTVIGMNAATAALSVLVCGPWVASLASRLGTVTTLLLGNALAATGLVAFAFFTAAGPLFVLRALIGFGAALGWIVTETWISLLPSDYEEHYFARGGQPTSFSLKGWRIGLVVCYEVEFPEPVRYHARHGCDLVVAPTALVERWTMVARKVIPARAFENTIFVAYANHCGEENGSRYLGESVIVSPFGEELVRAGSEETLLTARLDRAQITDARAQLRFLRHTGQSCYR